MNMFLTDDELDMAEALLRSNVVGYTQEYSDERDRAFFVYSLIFQEQRRPLLFAYRAARDIAVVDFSLNHWQYRDDRTVANLEREINRLVALSTGTVLHQLMYSVMNTAWYIGTWPSYIATKIRKFEWIRELNDEVPSQIE